MKRLLYLTAVAFLALAGACAVWLLLPQPVFPLLPSAIAARIGVAPESSRVLQVLETD